MGNVDPVSGPLDELVAHLNLLQNEFEDDADVEFKTAPIFTDVARRGRIKDVSCQETGVGIEGAEELFSQHGLIAGDISRSNPGDQDRRLFHNIAAPASIFICGSQGSGKSHTLSCLLENCLVPCTANVLPRPLTGIVFHYDTFISDTGGSPCEAAYLSSHAGVTVRVLCAPTNTVQIRVSSQNGPS